MSILDTPLSFVDEPFRFQMKRWTVEECETLREIGLLLDRYELLEGVILDDMRTSEPHQIGIGLLQIGRAHV